MPSGRTVLGVPFLFLTVAGAASLAPVTARAQASQDPTALGLINQGLALLNGGTTLSDVTLQASVTYTSGSDVETGTGTLQALNDVYGLVILNLTDGQRQYIRDVQGGWPLGAWVDVNGQVNSYAPQNCWTDAAWFFPGLIFTSVPGNAQVGLVNLGAGTWNGSAVNQVQLYQWLSAQNAAIASAVQGYGTEEVYLDPTSSLPLAIDFNVYSDNGAPGAISGEIQYSNYQTVQGMTVPYQVQRLVNGTVVLNITVTSVVVNSGLSPNLFNIPGA